ncbi:MAG: cytochrome, partial [Hyphomicrobiales bacterium]|nr:cytochrome [Hyphomicrobiales bacterium]
MNMRNAHPSRRHILIGAAATLAAPALAQGAPQVVVIGGGYAGATCARFLQRAGVSVTLVEPSANYISCPFSNAVIAGLRNIAQQTFTYESIAAQGVRIARQAATSVDRDAKRVTLTDGTTLPYDR